MNVKKIFIVLVTIVACVILGAFVLNILMPNVVTTVIDATEDMIYKATGLAFDFDKNGNRGNNSNAQYDGETAGGQGTVQGNVDGFTAGG